MPTSAKDLLQTHEEVKQELLDLHAEQNSFLTKARERFQELVFNEVDWWYGRARWLAEFGDTKTDQVKQQMVKTVLDKICPDRKELVRGAASVSGVAVQFNGVNMLAAQKDVIANARPLGSLNGRPRRDDDK